MGRWTRRGLVGAGALLGGAAALGLGRMWLREGGALSPGVSRAKAVPNDLTNPAQTEVVVIGGGNIGCMAALTLAERGVKVVLCEKGVIAGEASGRSVGYIDNLFLDPIKLPAMARSKELWDQLQSRLPDDIGFKKTGIGFLCTTPDSVGASEAWLSAVKGSPAVDARILSAAEATELAGPSSDRYVGGMLQPSDAIAEPQLFAPAVAVAARRAGAIIRQQCAVRGIETTAGRVSGVVTEHGPIKCQSVILAGGAWSPLFARSLGIDIPQFMAFSSVMRLRPGAGPALPCVSERGFILRPTQDGACDAGAAIGVTPITPDIIRHAGQLLPALKRFQDGGGHIDPVFNFSTFLDAVRIPTRWRMDEPSPFEARRILMPETRTRLLGEVFDNIRGGFPAFAGSSISESWAGALTSTLDNMPVLSPTDQYPGFYLGTGFYFGLAMGPAAGEALADLVMGKPPRFDLKPYRLSRFSDGSPIGFYP